MITIEDLREPKLKSGFRYVHVREDKRRGGTQACQFRAKGGGGNGVTGGKQPHWYAGTWDTALRAAQAAADYLNGVRGVPTKRRRVLTGSAVVRPDGYVRSQPELALQVAFMDTHGEALGLVEEYPIDFSPRRDRADMYNPETGLLIEAKRAADAEKIRFALGQLLDYMRHLNPKIMAVLVPERPVPDLMQLLLSYRIWTIWRNEDGTFSTNSRWAISL